MRYDRNKIIKTRRILRMKKAMAISVAFFIVFSFVEVDRNCGEMTGNAVRIVPRIVRVDVGTVKIKFGDTGDTGTGETRGGDTPERRGQVPVSCSKKTNYKGDRYLSPCLPKGDRYLSPCLPPCLLI